MQAVILSIFDKIRRMEPIFAVVFVGMLGGLYIVWRNQPQTNQKRQQKLARIADQLGLRYAVRGETDWWEINEPYPLLNTKVVTIENLMLGTERLYPYRLFDISYSGRGLNLSVEHTVIAFDVSSADLPFFILRRSKFLDHFGIFTAYEAVKLPNLPYYQPGVSLYTLDESLEEKVKLLISEEARTYFANHPTLECKCNGRWLLLYHYDREIPADMIALSRFIHESRQILGLLTAG